MPTISGPEHSSGDQFGGITALVTITPVIQAAAYATGDVIGGKMTLTGMARRPHGSGVIQTIILTSEIAMTSDIDIVFFSADPDSSTFTENAAIAVDADDADKVVGVVSLTAADHAADLGTPDVLTFRNVGLAFNVAEDITALYAVAVMRGAHTPGATDEFTWRFGVLQD